MTETPQSKTPAEHYPKNRQRLLSVFLDFTIATLSGKLMGLGLLLTLLAGLLFDSSYIERITGLGKLPLIGFTVFLAWGLWLWIMVERRDD